MERWGLRRLVLCALALMICAVVLTTQMKSQWELVLFWGVLVGSGTGVTSLVLAAVVANRWFEERRGLVLGMLSAGNATGQLVFLPGLARLVEGSGWRSAAFAVAAAAAVAFVMVWLLMRDRPEDLGLRPFGQVDDKSRTEPKRALSAIAALLPAVRSPAFWVLAGSFFICGASTNGLIGTHLIPACHDVGIPEVRAAGLLALMGLFDIAGTTASGWLTDRLPSHLLLFTYYILRGASLLYLPYTLGHGSNSLYWFALFYGLDWVATVPPTVRLTADVFGRENAGVIYGWIGAFHQLGASLAALSAGVARTSLGSYNTAFWTAGTLCFLAGFAFLLGKPALRRQTLATEMQMA